MRRFGFASCLIGALAIGAPAQDDGGPSFSDPTRLKAGGAFVRTEEPGFAAPCLADVNGDGKKDLVVGQFAGGKMKVYPGDGKGSFGAGTWFKVAGKVAQVPGVW